MKPQTTAIFALAAISILLAILALCIYAELRSERRISAFHKDSATYWHTLYIGAVEHCIQCETSPTTKEQHP